MANSDVDGGTAPDLSAGGRWLSETLAYLRHPRFYPARPQAACTGVGPDLNNAGRDDGAGPAAGGERLLSNRSADLRRASSSDADAP